MHSIKDQGSEAAIKSVVAEEMLHSTLVGNLLVAVAGRPDFRHRSPAVDKGPLVDRLYTLMSGLLSPAARYLMGQPVGSAWWRDRAVPTFDRLSPATR